MTTRAGAPPISPGARSSRTRCGASSGGAAPGSSASRRHTWRRGRADDARTAPSATQRPRASRAACASSAAISPPPRRRCARSGSTPRSGSARAAPGGCRSRGRARRMRGVHRLRRALSDGRAHFGDRPPAAREGCRGDRRSGDGAERLTRASRGNHVAPRHPRSPRCAPLNATPVSPSRRRAGRCPVILSRVAFLVVNPRSAAAGRAVTSTPSRAPSARRSASSRRLSPSRPGTAHASRVSGGGGELVVAVGGDGTASEVIDGLVNGGAAPPPQVVFGHIPRAPAAISARRSASGATWRRPRVLGPAERGGLRSRSRHLRRGTTGRPGSATS